MKAKRLKRALFGRLLNLSKKRQYLYVNNSYRKSISLLSDSLTSENIVFEKNYHKISQLN